MKNRFITTPIYYLNGQPHLGHIYTTIAADAFARYWRLEGDNIKFLTGTDEHGQKIAQTANKQGKNPQLFVNEIVKKWKKITKIIGSSHTDFIRTTQKKHYNAVQSLWQNIEKNGYIYKGYYNGWYSVRDEAYYNATEINNGKSPTGSPVEWIKEESYFFKLSYWQEHLLNFYKNHTKIIMPINRYKEVINFIKSGLHDLSISRKNLSWGIPVPSDNKHVIYVWIDALANYITAVNYPNTSSKEFNNFWPNVLHIIGKDILRFHTIYWPALLMAAKISPPKKIYAHGWIISNNEKMSKSIGNTIDPLLLIKNYGIDQVRYFLLKGISFGHDGYYIEEEFIKCINNDLSNGIGNLTQRVLSFIQKNTLSFIPSPGIFINEDCMLINKIYTLHCDLKSCIKKQELTKYCEILFIIVIEANKYMDIIQPWNLIKSKFYRDKERVSTSLYLLTEAIRHIAVFAQPIIPLSSSNILDQLCQYKRDFKSLKTAIDCSLSLPKPRGVFPRINKKNKQ